MINIVLVDDHRLIRQGIRELIDKTDGLRVVAEASNGEEAINILLSKKNIDIVLLDINMPIIDGIETLKEIRRLFGFKVKVIILTTYHSKNNVIQAIKFRANGFVTKDEDFLNLLRIIKNVYKNKNYLDKYTKKILHQSQDTSFKEIKDLYKIKLLSSREYEILELIATGYSNIEIAKELFISEKTVKNHITSIYNKIEVDNRVKAVIFCYKNKIVEI